MRQSTEDLIETLRAHAARGGVIEAALVVGFDDSNATVAASDPEALESLDRHVQNGGQPVGTLLVVEWGGGSALKIQALPEFEGEEWAEAFLATVLEQMRRDMEEAVGEE